jgi:hypothetical protein
MHVIIVKPLCLAMLMMAAAACSAESENDSFTHLTPIDAHHFALHRHDGSDAVVSSNGELTIDGKSVSLNPVQRDLVARYFAGASTVRDDALATGLAGAGTALTAIGSVASGLASGEPDKIGPAVEAKAAQVEAKAEKLCADLGALAATQNSLADVLAAFKPYATIEQKEVAECHRG